MNINAGEIKQLIEMFVDLNADRQKKLMQEAMYLRLEQGQEEIAIKEKRSISKEELKIATDKQALRIANFCEALNSMNAEQQAAIMMYLNKSTHGEISREETISITIDSRNLTLDEFLNKHLPGADLKKARTIFEKSQARTD